MINKNWSGIENNQKVGRYAEHFVKIAFLSHGFEVYASDVDDHGIDCIFRRPRSTVFYEIQVKSTRGLNYIFAHKDKFDIHNDRLYMVLTIFYDHEDPVLYLIPASAWRAETPLLKGKDYEGKISKPEWGINLSRKNMPLIDEFLFTKLVDRLS